MKDQSATPSTLAQTRAADTAYGVNEGIAWMESLFCAIQHATHSDAKKLAAIGQYVADRTALNARIDFNELNSALQQQSEVVA